ncbi:hypothetical protein B0H19DRAFT_1080700 [Mycena capillaripes]|nr:hypothetical protein B0H19DRAFT_1080700 [Mycena capillaripes]
MARGASSRQSNAETVVINSKPNGKFFNHISEHIPGRMASLPMVVFSGTSSLRTGQPGHSTSRPSMTPLAVVFWDRPEIHGRGAPCSCHALCGADHQQGNLRRSIRRGAWHDYGADAIRRINQVVENTSDVMQNPKVSYEKIVSTVGTWNDINMKLASRQHSLVVSCPRLSQTTTTHELSGFTMTQTTVMVQESINVPARTRGSATEIASQAKIDAPFTYKVKVVYRDASLAGSGDRSCAEPRPAHFKLATAKSSMKQVYRSLDTYDFKFVFGKFEPIDEE